MRNQSIARMDSNSENLSPLQMNIIRLAEVCAPRTGGRYVEVGANDGLRQSNTFELEKRLGWSGVLVEPSAKAFSQLMRNRSARRNQMFQVAVVSDSAITKVSGYFGTTRLTQSADPETMAASRKALWRQVVRKTLSGLLRRTLDQKSLEILNSLKKETVQALTLDHILEKSELESIDILVIDVEGMELEVLQGFNFNPKPHCIVVETRRRDLARICEILISRGFLLMGNVSPIVTSREFPYWQTDLLWVDNKSVHLNYLRQAALEP